MIWQGFSIRTGGYPPPPPPKLKTLVLSYLCKLGKEKGQLVLHEGQIPGKPVDDPAQRVCLEEPHGGPQDGGEHSVVEPEHGREAHVHEQEGPARYSN